MAASSENAVCTVIIELSVSLVKVVKLKIEHTVLYMREYDDSCESVCWVYVKVTRDKFNVTHTVYLSRKMVHSLCSVVHQYNTGSLQYSAAFITS